MSGTSGTGALDFLHMWYMVGTCGTGPGDAWYLRYMGFTCGTRLVHVVQGLLVHVVQGQEMTCTCGIFSWCM